MSNDRIKTQHLELASQMFNILDKIRRDGLMSIDLDIETPDSSELFRNMPVGIRTFVCDAIRMMVSGNFDEKIMRNYCRLRRTTAGIFANKTQFRFVEESIIHACIGVPPIVAIEVGRQVIKDGERPSFLEMEDFVKKNRLSNIDANSTLDERIDRIMKMFESEQASEQAND